MLKYNILIFAFFTVLSSQSFAQNNHWPHLFEGNPANSPRSIILYDPLFWKDQLKLNTVQQQKIDDINAKFYQDVKSASAHKQDKSQNEIQDFLVVRSNRIWGTFDDHQKRKWEKLTEVTALPDTGSSQEQGNSE